MLNRNKSEVINALSINLEDYYRAEAFAINVLRSQWPEPTTKIRAALRPNRFVDEWAKCF